MRGVFCGGGGSAGFFYGILKYIHTEHVVG